MPWRTAIGDTDSPTSTSRSQPREVVSLTQGNANRSDNVNAESTATRGGHTPSTTSSPAKGSSTARHPVPGRPGALRQAGGAVGRDRPRRSSSVAAAQSAPRSWPPGMPTSSTCPSSRWPRRPRCTGGLPRPATGPAGPTPVGHRWCSRPVWWSRSAVPTRRRSGGPPHCSQERAATGQDPVVGSPAQLVERLGEFSAIGARRIHLRLIDFTDLDHLELIAGEVLPQLDHVHHSPRDDQTRGDVNSGKCWTVARSDSP